MKLTGSLFVEESVVVHDISDIPTEWPISVVFDGNGGLFVNLTEAQALDLLSQLDNALRSIDHDRRTQ